MSIREAQAQDFNAIWPIFREILEAGETGSFNSSVSEDDARLYWMEQPRKTFVFEKDGEIVGAYYLKTAQPGPGSHVCKCFYMVASSARGQGVASEMCRHSEKAAVDLGYEAIAFNHVAASNAGAVKLWLKLGFKTVGRIPRALKHGRRYSDVLIMYKWLH